MKQDKARVHADRRPRIHIWKHGLTGQCRWSLGPVGNRSLRHHQTAGQAIDEALEHIAHQPAVIIFEGRPS